MLDKKINLFFKPILTKVANILIKYKFSPNLKTLVGFILGIVCFIFCLLE